jgi:predicted nucleic acid-binding protein
VRYSPGYLLDTNVISELPKRQPAEGVLRFLSTVTPRSVYLSVLTLGELRRGIAIKKRGDSAAAERLANWVGELERDFAERILGVDARTARIWGELSVERSRSVVDALLAATAIAHDLALVTRNVRDVQGLPLQVLNPWEKLSAE